MRLTKYHFSENDHKVIKPFDFNKKTHYCDQKCRVYTVFKLSKTKNLDTIWIQFGYNHDKIWIKGHGQYQS